MARVIAISDAVRTSLISAGVPAASVKRIYNPIRRERYTEGRVNRSAVRANYGFEDDHFVVATFGRITPWKGQLEFLHAVQLIEAGCPKLRSMIVGDDSDLPEAQYSAKIRQTASAMPDGLVTFVGCQNRVQDFYWASDCVVHNSIEQEPFGRVVSEAMACERAVIAIDEGGPSEIITSEVDGILVPPRDTEALAMAIQRLYDDRRLGKRLGEAASQTIESRFKDVLIADAMTEVYEQALASHSPRMP